MAIVNDNGTGMYMPVAPAYGGGYGNGGGFFGGDWAWIILLLLIGGNGWGLGGLGMGGMLPMMMGGMGGFGIDYLYPWLNNSQHMSDGFRDQQLNSQIGDLRSDVGRGFGDVQLGIAGLGRQICETGNGITGAVRDGFSAAEIAANQRQMANMQQSFGIQSAMQQGFCDNRAATADLKYTVATEACADRQAGYQNTRDIIDAIRSGNQGIMDKLCQLELDGVKNQLAAAQRDNANLQNQVILATERADRTAQTGTIIDGIYNRLASCPIDTTPVYGRQAIFQCPVNVNGNNGGCGCGYNGGFAA